VNTYVPTDAAVGWAQDLAGHNALLWCLVGVCKEGATPVVDDVVLVLAGPSDTGQTDLPDIILVGVGVPVGKLVELQRQDWHFTHQAMTGVPSSLLPPLRDTLQVFLRPLSKR
jgi:hypothetical protein